MGIEFGKNARKQVKRGDLVASFQYVNGEEALCLWRLGAIGSPLALKNDGAVVICLSAAHKYTEDDYLVRQSFEFAKHMGFGESKFAAHRIASFIQDMLIELLTMQPEPIERAPDSPEVEMVDGGARLVLH
jgi:hypothetical protein